MITAVTINIPSIPLPIYTRVSEIYTHTYLSCYKSYLNIRLFLSEHIKYQTAGYYGRNLTRHVYAD